MENIDKSKLTFMGSMNYVLQAYRQDDGSVLIDNYRPRKNSVCQVEIDEEEASQQITETIERMKIAISLMQDFLDKKNDHVYFWELNGEDWKLS